MCGSKGEMVAQMASASTNPFQDIDWSWPDARVVDFLFLKKLNLKCRFIRSNRGENGELLPGMMAVVKNKKKKTQNEPKTGEKTGKYGKEVFFTSKHYKHVRTREKRNTRKKWMEKSGQCRQIN